ncbi:hypothetical protein [Moraxella lincolnii]|uniref:MFS transporter n=1 Tax=Lwoffella lincolnii TaxID=90241 RepID=A0A1T0CK98_9GAMM|nr:hypothetical protein [Moraxella lincolnii]OOS22786.1 hypothetical protein B0682_00785 [Moraxella lincolnii]
MDLRKFYGALIVFYFSDMALLIMVIWLSYQTTKNPLILGLILCISTIIPFLLKRISKINLLSLSIHNLMLSRILFYSIIFILSALNPSIYGFIGLALISGLLGVSILSNYETYNNHLVVNNIVSANKASRYMQTVIQIGAFGGAMIGGMLLNYLSFFYSMASIVLVDIVFAIIFMMWAKDGYFAQIKIEENNNKQTVSQLYFLDKKQIYLLCFILGFVGIHIVSFNLTTPIIFQEVKQWTAQDFGLSSAFAGVGAFCAVFPKSNAKYCLVMAICLIFADLIFVTSNIKMLSLAVCFFIGFFINSIRILVREKLSLLAQNTEQAAFIGQISAVFYTIFQAGASLIFGYILASTYHVNVAQIFLPLVALIIFVLYVNKFFISRTSTNT